MTALQQWLSEKVPDGGRSKSGCWKACAILCYQSRVIQFSSLGMQSLGFPGSAGVPPAPKAAKMAALPGSGNADNRELNGPVRSHSLLDMFDPQPALLQGLVDHVRYSIIMMDCLD